MSDAMTVQTAQEQKSRSSALPYTLGGAVIGGTTGYFGANHLPFKQPMYKSYTDIINEVNAADSFETLTEGKSDNVKAALEAAKEQNNKLKDLRLSLQELTGANSAALPEDNTARKAYDEAVKALKEKAPTKEQIEEVAKELNKDAAEITDDMKKAAEDAIKNDKNKYRKYFENEIKAVEDSLDDLYKAAGNDKKIFEEAVETKYKAYNTAKDDVKKVLDPLLEKCKKGNKLLWAGIGAAALAILGLAISPKARD